MPVIVTHRFQFEAGHRLPKHPGACQGPHGHGYKMHVSIRKPVDPETGMAIDFHDMERVVRETVLPRLDHQDLNRILDNPTAEAIAVWVWDQLQGRLPGLHEIRIEETEACSATYRGD